MLRAFWFPNSNFGDNANHYILSRISRTGVAFRGIESPKTKIVAIGSILGWCNETTVAWGPGIGEVDGAVNPAADIRAVRGPRSYERAVACGCTLEPVFGDPALLLPYLYAPAHEKRFTTGIIPHYVDQDDVFESYSDAPDDTRLIDILDTPERVIDAILSCERIISSSLHGVIVAHAYGIPAAWASFSDKIGGDGTKYHDYFESVGCTVDGPAGGEEIVPIDDLLKQAASQFELHPVIDVKPLLKAAPFDVTDDFKAKVLGGWSFALRAAVRKTGWFGSSR